MASKTLFLLLGLVAFSTAMVIKSGSESSFGSIVDRLVKGESKFPALKKRSEKEWFGIISESLHGVLVPSYLQEKNYTYQANETGEYSDTDGFKGKWNSTTYQNYIPGDGELRKLTFRIRYEEYGDSLTATLSESDTLFTAVKEKYPSYGAAGVGESITVIVMENETYIPVSGGERISESAGTNINGSIIHEGLTLEMLSFTGSFFVSEHVVEGLVKVTKDSGTAEGEFVRNSIPLSSFTGKQSFSLKDSVSLAQRLGENRVSAGVISLTTGTYKGEFTVGKEGTYSYSSSSATQPLPNGNFMNSTVSVKGKYEEISETGFESPVPLYYVHSDLFSDIF